MDNFFCAKCCKQIDSERELDILFCSKECEESYSKELIAMYGDVDLKLKDLISMYGNQKESLSKSLKLLNEGENCYE
ncbi:MAG: hypothetical protein K2H01_06120 [Ruminococcus sp.]|nr:hypothetical protein [Ruminococcus sp.]